MSSHEGSDFSLQNTKKALNFEGNSTGSWHEQFHGDPNHKYSVKYERSHSAEGVLDARSDLSSEANRCYSNVSHSSSSTRGVETSSVSTKDLKWPHSSGEPTKSTSSQAGSKSIHDVLQPLQAVRLRQIRQRTRNAMVSNIIIIN